MYQKISTYMTPYYSFAAHAIYDAGFLYVAKRSKHVLGNQNVCFIMPDSHMYETIQNTCFGDPKGSHIYVRTIVHTGPWDPYILPNYCNFSFVHE